MTQVKHQREKTLSESELESEILERFDRGETSSNICKAVHKHFYFVNKVLSENGFSFKERDLTGGRKVTKTEIAKVEKLLKEISAEQIIKNSPAMRNPLICALYKSNTRGVIAEIFTNAGCEISPSDIGNIVQKNGITPESEIRKRTNSGYTGKPEADAEILERFHRGETAAMIRNALGTSFRIITKVLNKHGLSFKERGLTRGGLTQYHEGRGRKVQIGDRYGNWEVIAYAEKGLCLCRDVRNGLEKKVKDQNLYRGDSTGARELRYLDRKCN